MHHRVLQFSTVDIDDGRHEVEIRFLTGLETVVVLHADAEIGKIQCDPHTVDGDGHLDVAHHVASLLLDPFPDLHHHRIQPCLHVGIETVDVTGESDSDAACQLFGILRHQITWNTSFTPSPLTAHMGMTFTPGNTSPIHSLISFIFSGDVRSILFIAMMSAPDSCLM